MYNGVIIVDKPSGMTSHDVVDRVRRALRLRQVGHAGTLDPAATGVLPLLLGRATKLSRYLTGSSKDYEGTIRLGVDTDTWDADGCIVRERPVRLELEVVRDSLTEFIGDVEQVPPMFSAKKIGGRKLYELARKGEEVQRPPVTVRIDRLECVSWDSPDLKFRLSCSSGTYVRAVAHELGERLGCGGHLLCLRRTRVGVFALSAAVSLASIEENPGVVADHLMGPSKALANFTSVALSPALSRQIRSGHQLSTRDLEGEASFEGVFEVGDVVVLTDSDRGVIAVCRALQGSEAPRPGQLLKTERVLRPLE